MDKSILISMRSRPVNGDQQPAERLICLNFKVPFGLRKRFKLHAMQQNMTMTEMLIRVLERELNGEDKDIKK